MNRGEKIVWMSDWCEKHDCSLSLQGECGFGRKCVGVIKHDVYPEYQYDLNEETYEYEHGNDVWIPEDAYHKHPCVAVLGRGEKAEDQLFQWLKWFEENNYKIQSIDQNETDPIKILLGDAYCVRMVKD